MTLVEPFLSALLPLAFLHFQRSATIPGIPFYKSLLRPRSIITQGLPLHNSATACMPYTATLPLRCHARTWCCDRRCVRARACYWLSWWERKSSRKKKRRKKQVCKDGETWRCYVTRACCALLVGYSVASVVIGAKGEASAEPPTSLLLHTVFALF